MQSSLPLPDREPPLTKGRIETARRRISGIAAIDTPLRMSSALSRQCGRSVALKLENVQATGAFKLRGAANAILSLSPADRRRGVVTASSGNHGRALAYVASKLGIPATICLSNVVTKAKIDNIAALGVTVDVGGADQDAAMERAAEIAASRGMAFIPPFDHLDVIAGQATIGLEIVAQNPDVDTIIVPVSGGGLWAGVAFAAKAVKPDVRVLGVSMARGAAMYHSLAAGRPVHVEELATVADALQGGIGLANRHSFDLCRRYGDGMALVDEDQICGGIRHAFHREGLVLEGSGACGIAMVLYEPDVALGDHVVILCTGGNIAPDLFLDIVSRN